MRGSIAALTLGSLTTLVVAPSAAAQPTVGAPSRVELAIPRVDRAPALDDFLAMRPSPEWEGRLARVDRFIQRAPADGEPGTERTELYLAYDATRLYVIFVAFDSEPAKIRARLERREGITLDEDQVGFYLDTFDDRRRAYQFECNALGIQDDSVYSEDTGDVDETFDTVWDSRGAVTDRGYVVWMAVPFKSLRFPSTPSHTWSFAAWRWVARRSEGVWWPRETLKIRGILSQAAAISGISQIAGSRNMQFVPYATWRAFRALDTRRPAAPSFVSDLADAKAGLDSKFILNDSLVLDITANPDFAQVESDEPQSVVNQRFEVFFPERRPFFTENANYFEVPLVNANERFLFTRRIADPQLGVRLTGKAGAYSIGAVAADDRSPGERVPPEDPAAGRRAYFDAVRISRDLGGQSSVGTMYTERSFQGGFSRLFSGDAIVRLTKTWSATLVAAESWNRTAAGPATSGRDVEATLRRDSRTVNYSLRWLDRARDFHTDVGFIPRSDQRVLQQVASYTAYAVGSWLNDVKAQLTLDRAWNSEGGAIFSHVLPTLTIDFRDPTTVTAYHHVWNDVLRPAEYGALTAPTRYPEQLSGFTVNSRHFRFAGINAGMDIGDWINYVPAAGSPPTLARSVHAEATVTVRPAGRLQIANTYLLDESAARGGSDEPRATMFSASVFRSKLNWQLSREWSIRLIGQFNSLVTNPLLTSQTASRAFNVDVLLTYLVHPGTAFYIGYNSDYRRPLPLSGGGVVDQFGNDGRQLFVKMSYLFRP